MIPFGVAAGSEHQGGKHETGLAPVQAAVNHVTTLTIDGQNRDLVNLWRMVNLSAADQLILRMEFLPTKAYTTITTKERCCAPGLSRNGMLLAINP